MLRVRRGDWHIRKRAILAYLCGPPPQRIAGGCSKRLRPVANVTKLGETC